MSQLEMIFTQRLEENFGGSLAGQRTIINLMKIWGYRSSDEGVCYGVATLANQAQLSGPGELNRFNRRLALLPMLYPIFKPALMERYNEVCNDLSQCHRECVYVTMQNIITRKSRLLRVLWKNPQKCSA